MKDGSTRAPLPHAEHGFLREWMAELAGQHADLPAMVCIVCDEISDEAGDVRAKVLDAAVAFHGAGDDRFQRVGS